MVLLPLAMAANITDLWVMDLSGATLIFTEDLRGPDFGAGLMTTEGRSLAAVFLLAMLLGTPVV